MAIEGALQDVGLADICQLLSLGMKTGCLSITDRSNFGYIYFEQGRVVHASVLNRPDRLGELLARNAVISDEALGEALEEQKRQRGARLGQILIRNGALTEEQLERFIRIQIEEAVYHLFAWTSGSFHFDPDQAPDDDVFTVDLASEGLLLEGARRVDEWSMIEKKIPSFDLVLAVAKDPDQVGGEIELTANQRKVLPLIDGVRTVDEIITESGMVEFDVGKALFGLIQAGFVDESGMRAPEVEDQDAVLRQSVDLGTAFYRSGMLEDAEREFHAVLTLTPDNTRALNRLGLIALRRGRLRDALHYFHELPEHKRDTYAVQRNCAVAYEFLGRYDQALKALERADKLRPGDPELALARGIVLLMAGDTMAARDSLRVYRASDQIRRPSSLYYTYAVLAEAMAGDLEEGVRVGEEGLTHYPKNGALLVNVGAVLERRGESEAAGALYMRALAEGRPPAQAHKNLGDQAFERGEVEAARTHYEKAVKHDPALGDDVYLRLGTIAFKDGDPDVAKLLWRRALDLNPDNETVKANLGLLEPAG
jgi:tetratricopeptide (TPR) repeat protein